MCQRSSRRRLRDQRLPIWNGMVRGEIPTHPKFFPTHLWPLHDLSGFDSGPIFEMRQGMTPLVAAFRVLVVDDEPLIRWAVSETLRQAGHIVNEASDRATALHALATEPPPDVVLLDYRLPDSQGLRLLADVRRLAPAAAVLMMTAFGEDDVLEAAIALGATCVMDKPVDMHELDRVVRAAASH
jgi:CheY-like chemotaxis protein